MNKAGTFLKKLGVKLNKNSPEILLVAGLVGLIGAGVYACFQTPKAQKVVKDANKAIEEIGYAELEQPEDWPKTSQKEKRKICVRAGLKVAGVYGIPVVIGGLSTAAILVSRGIMKKRELSLAAAYATVDATLKAYRKRTREKYGEEVDNELRYGIRNETVTETTVDEDGKKKKVKKIIEVADGIDPDDDFSRFFDSSSRAWSENPQTNLYTLRCTQNYANVNHSVQRCKYGRSGTMPVCDRYSANH